MEEIAAKRLMEGINGLAEFWGEDNRLGKNVIAVITIISIIISWSVFLSLVNDLRKLVDGTGEGGMIGKRLGLDRSLFFLLLVQTRWSQKYKHF